MLLDKFNHGFATVGVALALSGCSGMIHIPFSVDTTPRTSLSIDARQRVIIATDRGGKNHDKRVICAEPSPDALVGVAASVGLDLNVLDRGSAKLGGSLAEALAGYGRTQTIQILRDGLYRACEAYLNGAITEQDYNDIILGFDDFAITILALDALGQRSIAPQVLITGSASSNVTPGGQGQAAGQGAADGKPAAAGAGGVSTSAQATAPAAQAVSVSAPSKEIAEAIEKIVGRYLCLQGQLYRVEVVKRAAKQDKTIPAVLAGIDFQALCK